MITIATRHVLGPAKHDSFHMCCWLFLPSKHANLVPGYQSRQILDDHQDWHYGNLHVDIHGISSVVIFMYNMYLAQAKSSIFLFYKFRVRWLQSGACHGTSAMFKIQYAV